MYPSAVDEKRFILRLYEYWQALRGDRDLPSPADIHLKDMGVDADYCVLITLGKGAEDAVISRLGSKLTPVAWEEVKGRQLISCPQGEALQVITFHLAEALKRVTPVCRGGYFAVRGERMMGRAILLPLSENGKDMTHILGGVNYKEAVVELKAVAPSYAVAQS